MQKKYTSVVEKFTTQQQADDDDLSIGDVEASIQSCEEDDVSDPSVTTTERKNNKTPWNVDAIGLSYLSSGRGMLTMSNIFMSSSLLYLAKEAAGCFDPEYINIQNGTIGEEIVATTTNHFTCDKTVHGMNPEAFITNIAAIGSILSALLMPVFGSIIDYTPYRRLIGIITALLLIIIQAIQMYTVEATWLVMGILQAVAILIYQLQIVAVLAYQPELSREVGQKQMTKYSASFSMINFVSSAFFLVVVTVISMVFNTSDVVTAQISQGFNTLTLIILFGIGWFKYMTDRPAVRTLPEGHSLITEGFRQNLNTAKTVWSTYRKGMWWYFLAVIFAEAAATAVVSVAVTYLTSSIQLNSTELGIFFIITLLSTAVGTQIGGKWITKKTNPNLSWKLSMVYLYVVLIIGAFVLDALPFELRSVSYGWAVFLGLGLGWFYPTGNLFFSMCLPKGSEAEFAGFWVYCSQILAWLGPLLFSVLVQYNVEQKYGVMVVAHGFIIGAGFLMFTSTWGEILLEAEYGKKPERDRSRANFRDLSRGDREALFTL